MTSDEDLVSKAAEASERFGDDECEEYAELVDALLDAQLEDELLRQRERQIRGRRLLHQLRDWCSFMLGRF